MTNKEIIRFSNWWLGASKHHIWEYKQKEFNEIIKTLPLGLSVVAINNNFEAKPFVIDELPSIFEDVKIVGVVI